MRLANRIWWSRLCEMIIATKEVSFLRHHPLARWAYRTTLLQVRQPTPPATFLGHIGQPTYCEPLCASWSFRMDILVIHLDGHHNTSQTTVRELALQQWRTAFPLHGLFTLTRQSISCHYWTCCKTLACMSWQSNTSRTTLHGSQTPPHIVQWCIIISIICMPWPQATLFYDDALCVSATNPFCVTIFANDPVLTIKPWWLTLGVTHFLEWLTVGSDPLFGVTHFLLWPTLGATNFVDVTNFVNDLLFWGDSLFESNPPFVMSDSSVALEKNNPPQ